MSVLYCVLQVLRSQQASGCSLPGQRFGGLQQTAPHILLCAPSNTAVDEVVKRLIRKGHVRNTQEWREKYKDQLLSNGNYCYLLHIVIRYLPLIYKYICCGRVMLKKKHNTLLAHTVKNCRHS